MTMDVSGKALGQALQDVPLGTMIRNLGFAIADAQGAMDKKSIEAAMALATEKATITDAKNKEVSKSLLELGFTPTFYQFTEADIELSVTISMRVEDETKLGFEAGISLDKPK